MKHLKNFTSFVLEKKMDITQYPNKDALGLVAKSVKRNGTTIKQLAIYDFKNDTLFAYIEMKNIIDKNVFEIERAMAEKNWGPLIYDFALMYCNPSAVAPSKTIKPAAIKIWKYYSELRPDVIKKPMGVNDESYMDKYKNDEIDEYNLVDGNLVYLNTYYFLTPSEEYYKLKENGDLYLKGSGMIPSDIFKLGYNKFKNKYLED